MPHCSTTTPVELACLKWNLVELLFLTFSPTKVGLPDLFNGYLQHFTPWSKRLDFSSLTLVTGNILASCSVTMHSKFRTPIASFTVAWYNCYSPTKAWHQPKSANSRWFSVQYSTVYEKSPRSQYCKRKTQLKKAVQL